MSSLIAIISEDAELVVINKSAGLVCHPTKAGPLSSLIGRVPVDLGDQAHPQLLHRLDRETSGVVLVAKTAQTARALRRLWEPHRRAPGKGRTQHGGDQELRAARRAPSNEKTNATTAAGDTVPQASRPRRAY